MIAHKVQIEPGSLLASVIGAPEIMTNSAHSEAVINEKCGNCIITAVAEDGTAEAVELKQPWNDFVLGVQWHPERFVKKGDQPSIKIFSSFIESAKGYQSQKKHPNQSN